MKRRRQSAEVVELRARRRDATRARLLEAGRAALREDRLLSASLAEIAAEAGLTTGAVYDHFGSREEFIVAVAETAGAELAASAPPVLDGSLKQFYDALAAYAAGLAGQNAPLGRLLMALTAEAAASPALAERLRGAWTVGRPDVVAQVKALAERSGLELALPAHQVDLIVGSLLVGLLQTRLLLGAEAVPDDFFREAVHQVLPALLK